MAKLVICAVRDSAAVAYAPPMTFPTIGIASRTFRDEVHREESMLFKHPEDYTLFKIGEFDDETGMLEPCTPEQLLRAQDMKDF